ncbi:MAG TPA: Uma2 family endonuclease [Thermoanaerobaculia bacterium]|nr:Uma2 family endonuclease [Thermoanaerobaculia bacterium]
MLNDSGRRYTYGDYVQWTGDERWELVDGQVFDMTPAPSRLHQQVVVRMLFQIEGRLRGHRCQVYVAPFDVRLPKGDEPDEQVDTVVQPDIVVICDPAKLDDAGCRGAPDWIVEILSPRTSARDQELKRDLYRRSGVREYWHLDPVSRGLVRYRRDEAAGGFSEPVRGVAEGRIATSVLPDLEVDFDEVFAD